MQKKLFWRALYIIAKHLPDSYNRLGGRVACKIRRFICSHIFEECGRNVNIEKGASFGAGLHIKIGDNSGLGINCVIPDGSVIGKDVMMAPNFYVHSKNHKFNRTDIPMRLQGATKSTPIIIDDDVWIGRDVVVMVGRHIAKGTIVAACSVVTKDFPPYSIIGGNPARFIRSRVE